MLDALDWCGYYRVWIMARTLASFVPRGRSLPGQHRGELWPHVGAHVGSDVRSNRHHLGHLHALTVLIVGKSVRAISPVPSFNFISVPAPITLY